LKQFAWQSENAAWLAVSVEQHRQFVRGYRHEDDASRGHDAIERAVAERLLPSLVAVRSIQSAHRIVLSGEVDMLVVNGDSSDDNRSDVRMPIQLAVLETVKVFVAAARVHEAAIRCQRGDASLDERIPRDLSRVEGQRKETSVAGAQIDTVPVDDGSERYAACRCTPEDSAVGCRDGNDVGLGDGDYPVADCDHWSRGRDPRHGPDGCVIGAAQRFDRVPGRNEEHLA